MTDDEYRFLIHLLVRALELTKSDADHNGFTYGNQAVVNVALRKAAAWEKQR
jgi:hypothetical protein